MGANALYKDLLLDSNHDLVIKDFDLVLTTEQESVGQRIKQHLLTIKGEWFLDTELGVAWFSDILGQKTSEDAVRSLLINEILKVDGVDKIQDFAINFDEKTRKIAMKISITDNLNNAFEIDL